MKKSCMLLLSLSAILALPGVAMAQDTASDAGQDNGWSGSGELGFAEASGNSHTQNINAKLGLKQENERWKNSFKLTGLRSKGDVTVTNAQGEKVSQFSTTANRYTGEASVGYKFDPRSYLVNSLRYEHDDFGSNIWQGTYSIGYGYIALKNARTELSFEVGPGYKRYKPAPTTTTNAAGDTVEVPSPVESEVIARGLINYKYNLTKNTAFENTLLVEAGSKNTYLQNDAGLSVSVTQKLALKVGYQVRYNSDVSEDTVHTDKLLTTNLVYNF